MSPAARFLLLLGLGTLMARRHRHRPRHSFRITSIYVITRETADARARRSLHEQGFGADVTGDFLRPAFAHGVPGVPYTAVLAEDDTLHTADPRLAEVLRIRGLKVACP